MTAPVELEAPLLRNQIAEEDTWDLSRIFSTDKDWEAAAARIPPLLATTVAHRGHLRDGASVAAAIEDMLALRLAMEHVQVYATLRHHEDMADPVRLGRYQRAVSLAIGVGQELSFFEPELLALPAEHYEAIIADPVTAPYRHWLEDIGRRRTHTRSIEVEEVLALSADVGRGPSEVFNALDNADISHGLAHDENGAEVAVTKGRHQLLLRSRDRNVRLEAHAAFMTPYLEHENTLAALYTASVRTDVFASKVRGFASARASALFDNNVPDAVYDNLISEVRAARPVFERFLGLRRTMLQVEDLHTYDLQTPLSPEPEAHYPFQHAVEMVLEALSALGPRYQADLGRGFAERWVDVYESKGKRSGAYSWGAYGAPPVILMNWNGTINDVFTLAHEAGHAMHTFYADAARSYQEAGYPILLAEVASTVNETLMNWYMLSRLAPDDALGRFGLLNRFTDGYYGTVVRQTMFAEFEASAHTLVESQQPVTPQSLSALYADLADAYLPGVSADDALKITWGRIPHFYRAFYVYQYATGLSTALSLAAAIRDEGDPARARYLNLLASGGSDYPLNLLLEAGVDLASGAPVKAGLVEFTAAVDEMESIMNSGALDEATI